MWRKGKVRRALFPSLGSSSSLNCTKLDSRWIIFGARPYDLQSLKTEIRERDLSCRTLSKIKIYFVEEEWTETFWYWKPQNCAYCSLLTKMWYHLKCYRCSFLQEEELEAFQLSLRDFFYLKVSKSRKFQIGKFPKYFSPTGTVPYQSVLHEVSSSST